MGKTSTGRIALRIRPLTTNQKSGVFESLCDLTFSIHCQKEVEDPKSAPKRKKWIHETIITYKVKKMDNVRGQVASSVSIHFSKHSQQQNRNGKALNSPQSLTFRASTFDSTYLGFHSTDLGFESLCGRSICILVKKVGRSKMCFYTDKKESRNYHHSKRKRW